MAACIYFSACKSSPKESALQIIETPIQFDEERERLSLQYLETRYGMVQEYPTITPRMVVVHWTAISSFNESFDAFDPVYLPARRAGIKGASDLNVSAHYLVDRDGTIHRLLPDTIMARHVIGLNHCAIGIENVGDGEVEGLTEAQLAANVQLIRHLAAKYPIEYIIGHYEYTSFETHELWMEVDEAYRTEKVDPGESFMRDLRKKLIDIGLKGPPN